MKPFFRYLLIFIVLGVSASAVAQNVQKPIKWRLNVKMTSATEGEAIVQAAIDEGWHLYGMKMPADGPKPTTIDLTGSEGVEFTGPLTMARPPKAYVDQMFGVELTCWETGIVFRRKFKVTDPATAKIKAVISFMGCNDETCLPPATEKLTKRIVIRK